MPYYKKEVDGLLHFYDDVDGVEQRVHTSREVAIAYTTLREEDGEWRHAPSGATRVHVFTHGTPEQMVAWLEAHNAHSPHPAQLKVLVDPLKINKALDDRDERGHHASFAALL
jgi:hypothetical protein